MRSMPGRFTLVAMSVLCIFVLTACCSNSAPVLRYITVTPATATIDAGATQQFAATAYYSDGTVQDQTSVVGWSSSSPSVATITTAGLATGVTNGTTTITASAVGAQASASLTVSRTLQSIVITPASATVALGGSQQYDAVGTFLLQNGTTTTQDLTQIATWNSTNANIPISSAGLASAPATGTGFSNITAAFDGVTSNIAILTLGSLSVTGIEITPATDKIAVGNTVALTALEVLSNSTTQPVSNTVTWAVTCTPTGAATIADNGVNGLQIVLGVAVGTCTITGTEGTFTATSTITVVAGTAHYAYIASGNSNWINQFSVSAASSTPLAPLSPATTPVTEGAPQLVFLHPNGLYAYTIVPDATSTVHILDVVAATGLMTQRTGDPTVPSGSAGPNIGVIDPTGRFLYVIDGFANTLNGFTISQTDGTLTALASNVTGLTTPSSTTGLNSPSDVLIDQTGQYLYVVNNASPGTISAFSISQTTGDLTPLSTPSYTVGNYPVFATITSANPATPYMYVPNSGDNTVSGFSIDPTTGLLTSLGTATPVGATSLAADNAIVDPTGKYLYVVDTGSQTTHGQVFGFNIGTGGAIGSAIAGLPLPTGFGPGGIAIDPTGKLLLIDNNVDNDISPYAIGASGGLNADTSVATGEAPFGIVFYVAP